ncbi:quinone-dependent dihydroorotate dehydrogenase [Flexibacter flexilis]|uniref:quinone-dependent dihydroorotate dehydrogenase n=1 Tax=Flexibacter flexilis TaxID=998 RepID=UPI000B871887|nr:quinone-dependent dihydroorotate dehydrogenase [Flexibacter flexilis]
MYSLIRPILFRFSPEKAHHLTFGLLSNFLGSDFARKMVKQNLKVASPALRRTIAGLEFENPVGLAAGLDKDAKLTDELEALGFGFIEIGTLTPRPQAGNPQPRLFRLPTDQALINRMGFNNEGVEVAAQRLKQRKGKIIIGGNIGKNKDTPNENAVEDYLICFDALYEVVDYFVVNVSSPNTPNLRALQDKEPLKALLETLQQHNEQKPKAKPIFLKIAPDLTEGQLDDIVEIVLSTKIAGVVATNTTLSRENLQTSTSEVEKIGNGGLSGKPLTQHSTEIIRYLHQKSGGAFPIVGVGGVMTAQDALDKLAAGASLIQIYTGFIYKGPDLIREINQAILQQSQQKSPRS